MTRPEIEALKKRWANEQEEWGVIREYTPKDVLDLRGTVHIEHTLAAHGAKRLRRRLKEPGYIRTGGARDGNDAAQMVLAGLEAIYLSGWQTAAGSNLDGKIFPDKSIHPASSFRFAIEQFNNGLLRMDQIAALERAQLPEETWGEFHRIKDWMVPIVADAEAGLGGTGNVYNLIENMIIAGVAGIHLEDQDSGYKKCGHMGGKVVIPTRLHIDKLRAARLAADVHDVPTVIIARTDANSAKLLSNDVDERDVLFMTGARTREGFYQVKGGLEMAIARGLAFAPYADILWCETSTPDMDEAREFAGAIHAEYPGKALAYNCSPSFNWEKNLSPSQIERFQDELGEMGYSFQFITLYGFHAHNHGMFLLSKGYAQRGMPAYVELQRDEFESAHDGYIAHQHQRFASTGYFDRIDEIATKGESTTGAMRGSTEEDQF